jgi:L-ribulose-5-phosphate 4-epimerase
MMLLTNEKKQIVETGLSLVSNNLAHDGQGNISIYDRQNRLIAITPSGIPYEERQPEDICVINLKGELVEGRWNPTSEYALHLAFYKKRRDVNAVLHTHAVYSTIYSITGKPSLPIVFAEAGMMLGKEIPVAPYARPSTEAVGEVTSQAAGDGKGAIMANHGLVAVAPTLDEALKISVAIEGMAHAVFLAGFISADVDALGEDETKILSAMYNKHLSINQRKPE